MAPDVHVASEQSEPIVPTPSLHPTIIGETAAKSEIQGCVVIVAAVAKTPPPHTILCPCFNPETDAHFVPKG